MTPQDLEAFDRDLANSNVAWTRDLALQYFYSRMNHPAWTAMAAVKEISMLGQDTLFMCRAYAIACRSAILEIGPYIGGSTVALGMGLDAFGRKPMVSIELGGSNLAQPYLKTEDIHADWHRNLSAHGVEGVSTLVKGWSYEQSTIAKTKLAAASRIFDVFFFDADGDVDRVLQDYSDQLSKDCLLIFDDYFNVIGGQEKIEKTTRQVHRLMEEGVVEQYLLAPFSTWFGRLARPIGR